MSIDKKILRNPNAYISDQGLTQTTQEAPVTIEEVDSSWMKATPLEGQKRGRIVGANNFQKFVPYQTKYESIKSNNSGIVKQGDAQYPWLEYSENTWADSVNFPPNFKGNFDIEDWYSSKIETPKELYQWKTDIFGNQYGLFKDFGTTNEPISLYERKQQFGDLWISSPSNVILPANKALSGVFANYEALHSDVFVQLTGNQIKNIDIFYDTLMIHTPTHIIFDKIIFDYDSGTITSVADYSHVIDLSASNGGKFGDCWFFEESKHVIFCYMIPTSGVPIPHIYDLDIEKNVLQRKFPLKTCDLTVLNQLSANNIISIDDPLFSYNPETKMFNIALLVNTQGFQTKSLILMYIIDKIKKFEIKNILFTSPRDLSSV